MNEQLTNNGLTNSSVSTKPYLPNDDVQFWELL